MAALLLCVLGAKDAVAQDYSGVYYIANDNSGNGATAPTYGNATTDAQKWYLVPADNPQFSSCIDAYYSPNHATQNGDPEQPFLTTYQTNKDAATVPSGVTERPDNSIWIVKKIGNTAYYYLIHATTGKYAIYEVPLPNDPNNNSTGRRKTMHLQTPDPDDENYSLGNDSNDKYKVRIQKPNNTNYYLLDPKKRSGYYLNPANNNRLLYHGEASGSANPVVYQAGLVGVYNSNSDGGSKWHFEPALCQKPEITYDGTNLQYEIKWHNSTYNHLPPNYKIYYSIDNGQSSEYNGPIDANDCTSSLSAWVIGVGVPISDTMFLDLTVGTPPPTFEITCDDGLAMNCSMEEADIYYRINNEITVFDPFNAGFECTLYEGPISNDSSILSGCPSSCPKFYAFAYQNASASVQVDTTYRPNTEPPVITLTNETTASISFVTGATLYYTTNGNDPDTLDLSGTGTTEYSGSSPLTINSLNPANDLHIRAIAKLSDRGASCPVTVMKRPKWPEYAITSECIAASRFHLLNITTQSDRTYWYALSIGSGQQAPSESEFIQYTGQAVDFTTIPGYDNSSVDFTLHLFAKDADDNKSVVLSDDVSLNLNVYTAAPVITFNQNTGIVTITDATAGVTIYYTVDGGNEQNVPSSSVTISNLASGQVHTITAWAQASGLEPSCLSVLAVTVPTTITNLQQLMEMTSNGAYLLGNDIENAGSYVTVGNAGTPFIGYFDGGGHTISGLNQPLFGTTDGAVVKNVRLKSVAISSSADTVGAIACIAKGYSRIYNCGILPNSTDFPDGTHPTVTTTGNCAGGLVGSLRDDSRVINCYSYADVQATNTASGIVGNNNFESTAAESGGKYTKLRTAIVNCMFYGDIDGATNQYGVYGGKLITNAAATGINSYNFFRNGSKFTAANGHRNTSGGSDNVVGNPTKYNCSFPADERYLTQVEFHRSLLNSNRELCGWWVGSDVAPSTLTTAQVQAIPKDASIIYKWVVDPNLAPYPILKPFGKYPSIVNGYTGTPWFDHNTAAPYQGKQLGTLSVTVKSGDHSSASDQTLTIPITDMDTLHYDFGYYKVQLPYFNTVFGDPESTDWTTKYAGNYTDYVVTGWKVTNVVTDGTVETYNGFVANWETGYNFADRKCIDKDIYSSTNPRVFAQGGNYYVPDGVTAITIEAYWGKAIYIRNAEASYDRVNIKLGANTSPNNYFNNGTHFAPAGTRDNNVNGATIQTATEIGSIRGALTNTNIDAKKTVYDYALVLVGNVQELVGKNDILHPTQSTRGYTIMSVDLDFDEEPDYCLEWQLGYNMGRQMISPVRFDFLPVIELGIAGKLHNSTNFFSLGCFRSKGHFEVTETAFIRFGQFEFELKERDEGPVILNGGIYDQYCRGRNEEINQHINYVILGGHIVMPSFTPGAHVNENAKYKTRHCAVNALGGDFTSFYLTGGFNEAIEPFEDNPHCYIDGGRFGTIAAAYKEGIWGDVTWRINHALIGEFYGGGVMSQKDGATYKIVKGNINVVINNSIVGKYCGGPKFGDMVEGKTVTTSATGTTFGHYYGAGNGGTNYVQYASTDDTGAPFSNSEWNTKVNSNYHPEQYRTDDHSYEADYDFEVINYSSGDQAGKVVSRSYYYSAQFATTNTGDVTSTLKQCTVKNNFYGAGFLGGVTGTVTSLLDGTRVMGSAFGAGYSASSGTVTIHDKTKTPPVPNTYTGMITYNPGGTSTTYTWTHDSGSTSSPVTGDSDELFYTEVPLTNLGAVSISATLTIKGDSEIGTIAETDMDLEDGTHVPAGSLIPGTGNVFGGGDQSAVMGDIIVRLQGSTHVHGNVYGGGNEGEVGGNSSVIFEQETSSSQTGN